MRAQCCICADLFENSGNLNIAAVPCGHTFHEECLMRWLANSSTCPSCRKQVKKNQIIKRLYFDIPEIDEEAAQDPDTLHNQIAALKAQISSLGTLKHELTEVQDKLAACVSSKEQVREELKKAEKDREILKRHLSHVGEENISFQRQLDNFDATKKKLKRLESVKLMLEGTEDDVSEMVKCHGEAGDNAVKQLSSMVVVMKREYSKALDDKRALRNENREINLQVILTQTKMNDMKKELKKIHHQLKESNKTASDLERENNGNRRKIAHLRNALKRNKTEGSRSFIAAVNEESPNVAYTPPPPSLPLAPLSAERCLPSGASKSDRNGSNDNEISKSNSKSDRKCTSPDLFEESICSDDNNKDDKGDNVVCNDLNNERSSNRDSETDEKREFYESAPSVLKMIRITSAAEKFQAAKQRKIELEKESAPPIPYSHFSIMQKKLTGLSNSRPLSLLKSNIGLPPSRAYNGLGWSSRIEEPFETPVRVAAKQSQFLKKKVAKKRCPLASKPIPNQPKLKSCFPTASSTPFSSCSEKRDSSLSSNNSSNSNTSANIVSPVSIPFSTMSDKSNKNKAKQKQVLVQNMFAKSSAVKKAKRSVVTTASSSATKFKTVGLDRPDDDVIDLT